MTRSLFLIFASLLCYFPVCSQQNVPSFSISSKDGKYTSCYDNETKLSDKIASIIIAKATLKLDNLCSTKRLGKNTNFEYYDDVKCSFKDLTKNVRIWSQKDKASIQNILMVIEKMIYSQAKIIFPQSAGIKSFKLFDISIAGSSMNIIQPTEPKWSLEISEKILKEIFFKCTSSIFERSDSFYDKDDELLDSAELDPMFRTYETLTSYIDSRDEYFKWMALNPYFDPPCFPYISKAQFTDILNDKSIFRRDLTNQDSLNLEKIKIGINSDRFKGQLIVDPSSLMMYDKKRDYFNSLYKYLDSNKISGDLKKLIDQIRNRPLFKEFNTDYDEETFFDWLEIKCNFLSLSIYINAEIEKYLIFVIAHESYHAWIQPGIPGAKIEFDADKFASLMYLTIFNDSLMESIFWGNAKKVNDLNNIDTLPKVENIVLNSDADEINEKCSSV